MNSWITAESFKESEEIEKFLVSNEDEHTTSTYL